MRLKHIDILRGIAALMVTVFHLSGSSGLSKHTAAYGRYGYLGVEIFFVISGFVLPYSLDRSGYKIKNFFTFILKRIIRIYPAYIAIIIVGIAMAALTGREATSPVGFALHLVFLNSLLGYHDISPVFWTLKIEFAFYLLLGFLFTHLFTSNYKTLVFIFIITALLLFNVNIFLLSWLPFFAMGILIFNKWFTNMNAIAFWGAVIVLTLLNLKIHGVNEAVAGCFALLFILYVKIEYLPATISNVFLWLGTISYSLYLVHWELGRAAVAVCRHIPLAGNSEVFRVVAGIGFSLLCAYILYMLIEKPSIKLANKIIYKKV